MTAARSAEGVQSLDRAFLLLELMADAGGEVAISRLASDSGLAVSTIHRLVRTLVARGYVRQLPVDRGHGQSTVGGEPADRHLSPRVGHELQQPEGAVQGLHALRRSTPGHPGLSSSPRASRTPG